MGGKLEKMLILAYDTSEAAEGGGVPEVRDKFEALINPETYTIDYKVKMSEVQAPGTIGVQAKFVCTLPEELTFEFLFDNTGIIDGKSNPDGVLDNIKHLQKVLIGYQGESHETSHLKLVWGNQIFKGRAIELGITYKLFNPDGKPIRAVAKVKFTSSIENKKRVEQQATKSSDLTHIRRVKAGDTLPLMCHRIYGDPKYYLQVAQVNVLGNFRFLTPGTDLVFPPIAKVAE